MNSLDKFYTPDPIEFSRSYLDYLKELLNGIELASVERFIRTMLDARERGATVFFVGNGGSAATASHFANDLAIGTNTHERPFRAVSLADNNAVMTAISNDFGYEEVFTRQLRALGRPGDVLVAISASGNSPNLLSAIRYAKGAGIKTIAMTAFDGGKMKQEADECVHVPTLPKEYGPAEDIHLILNHLVGSYLMRYVKNA